MALTVNGIPITPAQLATLQADLGIVVAEEVTNRFTTLEGTDDAIFLRAGTPGLASASVIAAFTGGGSGTQTLTPTRLNNTSTFFSPTVSQGGGGSVQWLGSPTEYVQYSALTSHPIPVPPGGQVGDMLVLAIPWWAGEPPTSVVTDTSQSLGVLAQYSSASEVGSIRGVVISGSVPTTVTVTATAATELRAHLQWARGVAQVAGTVLDGNSIGARAALSYNSSVSSALVMSLYSTSGSNARVLTAFTPVGGAAGTVYTKWPFSSFGVATGVHSGATGVSDAAVTWSEADTAGGRHLSVTLRA